MQGSFHVYHTFLYNFDVKYVIYLEPENALTTSSYCFPPYALLIDAPMAVLITVKVLSTGERHSSFEYKMAV